VITLINPNLIAQENDLLTTGVVYMPITLAYLAAKLRKEKYEITVIDAYGENPKQVRRFEKFYIFGLFQKEILSRIPQKTTVAFVFAINLTNHNSTKEIIQAIKKHRPEIKVVVLENTQAVTAYALKDVANEFYSYGADYILTGEAEFRSLQIIKMISENKNPSDLKTIDGLGTKEFYNPPKEVIKNLDELPFPAWDLFPLPNYWNLGFAHGPLSSKKYLPILTSRGCPYPCTFCVIPATNNRKWRPRSAINVVDELEKFANHFNVQEFHIEDVNPTISDQRIRAICQEIIKRNLNIVWKIAAGTKVETINNEETIRLMAKAGCRYISISPETGSKKILKAIQKPFNHEHAQKLITQMNQVGIYSQACFVIGFPGEEEGDRAMTWELVKQMTKDGVDEIALFIITPVPGSSIFEQFEGYNSLSELNFTPTWREDYSILVKFRLSLYIHFLLWKFRYHPLKIVKQTINFVRRRFDTKMEMVPYRALVMKFLARRI
jgi:anaerobic magnesium-protoporphyrin IX monomethyl ester cyclase